MNEIDSDLHSSGDTCANRLHCIARMAFGLTHELNNVLGAIQNNVEIMRAHLPADTALKVNLNHIQHATRTAIHMSNTMQLYTQYGQIALKPVNLPSLLSQVVTELNHAIPENCTVVSNLSYVSPFISTNLVMLKEAVIGIIQNAVDALRGTPGTITIESTTDLSRIHQEEGLFLGKITDDTGLLMEIRDTGDGMSPEILQHVLEPFFTTHIRAQGLGLAPTVGLVFHCNAALQILSSPDEGTVVRLCFPSAS